MQTLAVGASRSAAAAGAEAGAASRERTLLRSRGKSARAVVVYVRVVGRARRREHGELLDRNGHADEGLDILHVTLLVRFGKRDRAAFGAGARGAADAVHIIGAVHRQIVID